MITKDTLEEAREVARELRKVGDQKGAEAIEVLIEATDNELPALDLLTSGQAGNLLGVSAQTIKNWVRRGKLPGYRVGERIMVPRDAVAKYVERAKTSLELEEISDEEAARMVSEGRRGS